MPKYIVTVYSRASRDYEIEATSVSELLTKLEDPKLVLPEKIDINYSDTEPVSDWFVTDAATGDGGFVSELRKEIESDDSD